MSALQEVLRHEAAKKPYDPAERRERYLRERKLKGRRPGGDREPIPSNTGRPIAPRPPKSPSPPKATPVTPARVAALQARLAELKVVLARLVEQAKAEAGVETTTSKKSAESDKPEKQKTAAEKKEDAKKAKERRDKEPDKPDTVSSVQAQIESIRNQIADMRAKLAAARKAAPNKPNRPEQTLVEPKNSQSGKSPTVLEGRQPIARKENRQNGRS